MPVKTLSEINKSFVEECSGSSSIGDDASGKERKKRVSIFRIVSDVLFYFAILVILYSVLSFDTDGSRPRVIMGYSYFTVMSSSMRDEIPKGSLIIIRETPASMLKVSDNITFTRGGEITVTHKIIDVSVGSSGQKSFQTKGVNNAFPDDYTVAEADVLGKVVFVIPYAGSAINWASENIHIILIIFLLSSLLSFVLKGFSKKR